MDTLAYRNGTYVLKSQLTIEPDDLGFERGFGVFDYCRIRNRVVTFMNDHISRLGHSQSILNLQRPIKMTDVEIVIEKLMKENDLPDAYMKMMITGKLINNKIEPILTIFQDQYNKYPESMFENGIALILHEFAKPFPDFKTTFYLGSLREQFRMTESGAEDILLYDGNQIRECARCNIFIVRGDTIYTPDKNMLKGVTRKHVMNCARDHAFVVENDITVEDIFSADEVFITSTTKNIMPVVRIEDKLIADGKPGTVTKKLMQWFEEYCRKYGME